MPFEYLDEIVRTSHTGDLSELFNLSFGAGDDVGNTFEVIRRLRQSRPMQRCLSILLRDPASRRLIESREPVPPHRLDSLLQLPKGTLGRSLGEIAKALNYDLNFYPKPDFFHALETDADYVNYRVLATHDIHHIVSGFALNRAGETGVLSLSVRQFAFPGFAFIDIASLLRTWLTAEKPYRDLQTDAERIENPRHKLECIVRGMAMGDEAQLLFPVDWSSLMDRDLEEVRQMLGIQAVREGLMSWYSDPALVAAVAR